MSPNPSDPVRIPGRLPSDPVRIVGDIDYDLINSDGYPDGYVLQSNGLGGVEFVPPVTSAVNTVAASGATETLDTSGYAVHDVTITADCTFTFSNPLLAGNVTIFMVILRQDGIGGWTPTWPGSVDWEGGLTPLSNEAANNVSEWVFYTIDGGTTWIGALTKDSVL